MAVERAPKMYVARPGAHINNASAQVVGEELDAIFQEEGSVTPSAVVARAATPGTALNSWDSRTRYFQWNDADAADAYREEQARLLIRSVIVRVEHGDETLSTRAYVVISDDDKMKTYQPVSHIASDPKYVLQVKTRFQNELMRLDKDYRAFLAFIEFAEAFGGIFEQIDASLDALPDEGDPRLRARLREKRRRTSAHV